MIGAVLSLVMEEGKIHLEDRDDVVELEFTNEVYIRLS